MLPEYDGTMFDPRFANIDRGVLDDDEMRAALAARVRGGVINPNRQQELSPQAAAVPGNVASAAGNAALGILRAPERAFQASEAIAGRPYTDFTPEERAHMLDPIIDLAFQYVPGGISGAERGALGAAGGKLVIPEKPKLVRGIYDPIRNEYPQIYERPDVIAAKAAANVAPEHPALKDLFGVTRDDLYGISQQGRRPGNAEPSIAFVDNPRGSYAAQAIMTPQNARRLVNALGEAEKYPQLTHGMDAWYVMDPYYKHLESLVGPEQARQMYRQTNTVVPMFSPGSDVLNEINRGTAARMMLNRGEWPTFLEYAGMKEKARGADFPGILRDVKGHAYHKTSQAGAVERWLQEGAPDIPTMQSPKVPLYMQASGVPEIGFQTKLPVPDAHFTRAVGMSDVRKSANPGESMSMSEFQQFAPWYVKNVANKLGIEAVPAQARQWGLFGHATGVDTPVGAPKLELFAQKIWERAQKLGVDPKWLRDQIMLGKEHAQLETPSLGALS